ncbi:MAG: acyl-CoA dehydrogenase family protein [Acidimicrobiales bacterium]
MRFDFDDDQRQFAAHLRAFTEKECTPDALRLAWDSELGWTRERWKALGELGVLGVTVPVEGGGLGLGMVDLMLLLEEAGRSGLPEPLLETTAIAVPVLLAARSARAEQLRDAWLAPLGAGEATAGCAAPDRPDVVPAGTGLSMVWRDGALHALTEYGWSTACRSIDGARRFVRVDWEPSPGSEIATGDEAVRLAALTCTLGAVGAAAVLVGAAQRMIDMAGAYAAERVQFGRAIGTFEAVKHHLANALMRVTFARPLVHRAALSIDESHIDASCHASMAKAAASDAATLAARVALQVHGAIGYTWEHDLHLWMKRAWALSGAWGDAAQHRAAVLAHVSGT